MHLSHHHHYHHYRHIVSSLLLLLVLLTSSLAQTGRTEVARIPSRLQPDDESFGKLLSSLTASSISNDSALFSSSDVFTSSSTSVGDVISPKVNSTDDVSVPSSSSMPMTSSSALTDASTVSSSSPSFSVDSSLPTDSMKRSASATITYEDVMRLERQCGSKNTCSSTRTRDNDSANKFHCSCDLQCILYGDCCLDAPVLLDNIRRQWPSNPSESRPLVFDDPAHEALFELNPESHDLHLFKKKQVQPELPIDSDPIDPDLASMDPFSDSTQGRSASRDASAADLTSGYRVEEMPSEHRAFHDDHLSPRSDTASSTTSTSLDSDDAQLALYNRLAEQLQQVMGEKLLEHVQMLQQHQIEFDCIQVPANEGSFSMRSRCPPDWRLSDESRALGATSDEQVHDIRRKCEQSFGVTRIIGEDPLGDTPLTSIRSGITYRNMYCAICNNPSVERQAIDILSAHSNAFKPKFGSFAFNDSFDFEPEDGLASKDPHFKSVDPAPSAEARVASPDSKLNSLSESSPTIVAGHSFEATALPISTTTTAGPSTSTVNRTSWRDQFIFWQLKVTCNDPARVTSNLSRSQFERLIREHLSRDPSASLWNIPYQDKNGEQMSFLCELQAFAPPTLTAQLRTCKSNVIRTCSADWPSDEHHVRALCSTYQAQVYYKPTQQHYWNAHCAHCNRVPINHLACAPAQSKTFDSMFVDDFLEGRTPLVVSSFAIIFDVNVAASGGSNVVGERLMCNERSDLVYDPFQRICRPVFCDAPNTRFVNGRCVPQQDDRDNASMPITSTSLADTSTNSMIETENRSLHFDSTNDSSNASSIVTSSSSSAVVSSNESNRTLLPSLTECGSAFMQPTELSEHFRSCAKLKLHPDEYLLLANGSIYLPDSFKMLSASEYQPLSTSLVDHRQPFVLICVPVSFASKMLPKFSSWYEQATFFTSLLSVICLALHLLFSMCVSELRNLSGLNLCSLSVALLGAYTCFMGTQFTSMTDFPAFCLTLSLTKYYFLLASFCWMTVIAFDIHRTIRDSLRCFKYSSGAQWHRFVIYSILAWAVPLLACAFLYALHSGQLPELAAVLDPSLAINDQQPPTMLLGQSPHCWISSRSVLFVTFLAPVGLALLLNLILFSATSRHLIATTRQTRAHTLQTKTAAVNYSLYARLALLMGMCWLIGLAAAKFENALLWAIFLVFNSLQGVFIFAAFTCKQSVWLKLKARLFDWSCCAATARSSAVCRHRDSDATDRRCSVRPIDLNDSSLSSTRRDSAFHDTSSIDHADLGCFGCCSAALGANYHENQALSGESANTQSTDSSASNKTLPSRILSESFDEHRHSPSNVRTNDLIVEIGDVKPTLSQKLANSFTSPLPCKLSPLPDLHSQMASTIQWQPSPLSHPTKVTPATSNVDSFVNWSQQSAQSTGGPLSIPCIVSPQQPAPRWTQLWSNDTFDNRLAGSAEQLDCRPATINRQGLQMPTPNLSRSFGDLCASTRRQRPPHPVSLMQQPFGVIRSTNELFSDHFTAASNDDSVRFAPLLASAPISHLRSPSSPAKFNQPLLQVSPTTESPSSPSTDAFAFSSQFDRYK